MGRSSRPGFGQEPTLGEPPERRYLQHLIAVLHPEYPTVFGVHAPTGADRGGEHAEATLVLFADIAGNVGLFRRFRGRVGGGR